MGFIQVGIHNNLRITDETKINEHGTLELSIEQDSGGNSAVDALMSNSVMDSMKSSFRFYPPNLKDFDGNTKTGGDLVGDLTKIRYQMSQYLYLYATKQEVDAAIGGATMFAGLGIDTNNREEVGKAIAQLIREDFMKKVMANMANNFLNFCKAKGVFTSDVRFRQKFLRQSKAKHYATISNSNYDVWIEDMSVPADASKVAFSDYEKDKGKDDPNPVASDPSANADAQAKQKAANLFGEGAANQDLPAAPPLGGDDGEVAPPPLGSSGDAPAAPVTQTGEAPVSDALPTAPETAFPPAQ